MGAKLQKNTKPPTGKPKVTSLFPDTATQKCWAPLLGAKLRKEGTSGLKDQTRLSGFLCGF